MSFESAVTGAPGPVYELCSGGEDRRSHRTTAEWMLPERSRNFQNSFSPGGIVSRVSSVTRATLLGPLVHPSAACGSRHGRGPQETFTEWSQNEQPPVWVRAAAAWPTKSPVWPRPSSSRQWQQPDVPGEGGTLQERVEISNNCKLKRSPDLPYAVCAGAPVGRQGPPGAGSQRPSTVYRLPSASFPLYLPPTWLLSPTLRFYFEIILCVDSRVPELGPRIHPFFSPETPAPLHSSQVSCNRGAATRYT